ncbi:hypothetical protein K0T92_05560 [Paenibacillus oenotherae]|uniref:Lipoprotein n=1 Tax=Paenibacillus oenotherae TaxID=1435645 RepID=A0ABS7D4T9_9BACL|nr:hypothetical protein [Paenibacillus oenotherae]MBW7474203.1 hypothetical protein [Paenibacillus oenotherae]
MRKWIVAVLAIIAGCGAPSDDKTAEELLSLSIAGLSGIDHYTFSGVTGIAIADGSMPKPTTFEGTVEEHHRIQMKRGREPGTAPMGSPYELLEQIQAGASSVVVVPSKSGSRTAVLRVEMDRTAALREWRERLRSDFDKVIHGTGTGMSAEGKAARMMQANKGAVLEREWQREINRSRRKLEEMLRTLDVQTAYTLVIDRKRMVPLRLQEQTVLHYEAGGEGHQESRETDITLRMLPDGKR